MAQYDFYISTKQCKSSAKDYLRGSWGLCAKTTLVYFLFCLMFISVTVFPAIFVKWWLALPIGFVSLMFISIFSYGYDTFCLNLVQNNEAKISQLFAGFSKKIGSVLKVFFKKFFLAIFWLVLLIVPFFVNFIGYSMANFLMIDKANINGNNCLKESKHIMQQNYKRYTKLLLSFTGWILLGIVSVFVGMLWIYPMFNVNRAIFYENLKTDF